MTVPQTKEKRERTLLHLYMTTKEWEWLLILTTLFHSKISLHGRKIQKILEKASDGSVHIPSSHLYPHLSQMEKEGYVKSLWEKRQDPNARYRKFYNLTPLGKKRYASLKSETQKNAEDYLKFVEKLLSQTVPFLSDDSGEDLKVSVQSILSFLLLQMLDEPEYAHSLKRKIKDRYNWSVKNGTLYPLLSDMDVNGFVTSHWGHIIEGKPILLRNEWGNPVENQTRLVRFYQVTDKGVRRKKIYGQRFRRNLEELLKMARFTCDYVYNLKKTKISNP